VERVGGSGALRVDVRVLVATHRNLEDHVRKGLFREDLFHRIYVFPILLPPLRERKGDVPALIEYFAKWLGETNGWKPKGFTPEAVAALERHAWPGNVRELRNTVERLLLLADDAVNAETVRLALPHAARLASAPSTDAVGPLARRVEDFERETIRAELDRNHHNMTATARALGLERSHLYKKCAHLGIALE
jgi:two-component system nitrogen regulation response regulator NtrX